MNSNPTDSGDDSGQDFHDSAYLFISFLSHLAYVNLFKVLITSKAYYMVITANIQQQAPH
jgi:hypothetical protein